MSLALQVDKIEDVAEPLREHYKQQGDKYVLDVPVTPPEDTAALKKAVAIERKAREQADARARAFADLGKTPEEIQELLEREAAAETERARKAGEFDKIKEQLVTNHQKDLAKKDQVITEQQKIIKGDRIDARATAAIVAANGDPVLLLPHVKNFVTVDEKYNPVVIDAQGTPRVDGQGNPFTIAMLVDEMKQSDTYARGFINVDSGGGATNKGNGGNPPPPSKPPTVKRKSDLKTREERSAFLREHGEAAYVALPY